MKSSAESTIVLTGATGFLGAFLMEALLERGYFVTVLGRPSGNMSLSDRLAGLLRWFHMDPGERLKAFDVDLSQEHLGLNDTDYGRLCWTTGQLIHCASDTSFAERNRARVLETNVHSLTALLDFAADSHVEHLYYVSTAYVSGANEGLCLEKPVSAGIFENVYEESKAKAEEIMTQRCKEQGLPLSILRPSIVYGHSNTGKSLKFQALYYAVKSLAFVRDIFIKDITEQGGERSKKWGFRLDDNGILHMPLELYLPNQGTVNLIPVDYFVGAALHIIENPDSEGIYHITSDDPPEIITLMEYAERFLGIRGIRALWNQSGHNPRPNPAEELFGKFMEQYHPYLSDRRAFDRSRTNRITEGLSTPPFDYNLFEKCMGYAASCNWGKEKGFPV